MALYSETYGLPYAGGWMEQPAGDMERMSICLGAYRDVKDFRGIAPGTGAQWQLKNPDKWETVKEYLGL